MLLGEVRGYPGVETGRDDADRPRAAAVPADPTGQPDGSVLSLFSTIATFGTALDVTLAELSIEAFFPADDATQKALQSRSA